MCYVFYSLSPCPTNKFEFTVLASHGLFQRKFAFYVLLFVHINLENEEYQHFASCLPSKACFLCFIFNLADCLCPKSLHYTYYFEPLKNHF